MFSLLLKELIFYFYPPFLCCFFIRFFKLAGNEDRHKISDEFEFRPDLTTPYSVRCMGDLGMQVSIHSFVCPSTFTLAVLCHCFTKMYRQSEGMHVVWI